MTKSKTPQQSIQQHRIKQGFPKSNTSETSHQLPVMADWSPTACSFTGISISVPCRPTCWKCRQSTYRRTIRRHVSWSACVEAIRGWLAYVGRPAVVTSCRRRSIPPVARPGTCRRSAAPFCSTVVSCLAPIGVRLPLPQMPAERQTLSGFCLAVQLPDQPAGTASAAVQTSGGTSRKRRHVAHEVFKSTGGACVTIGATGVWAHGACMGRGLGFGLV